MPEKGWSIITVRDFTKQCLLDMSKEKGISINDLVFASVNGRSHVLKTERKLVSKPEKKLVSSPERETVRPDDSFLFEEQVSRARGDVHASRR